MCYFTATTRIYIIYNSKFAVCAGKDVYKTIKCCLIINCIDIAENYKSTYEMLFSLFCLKPHL